MITCPIRHSRDVGKRLMGHRYKCGGKFRCIPEPKYLMWVWRCDCGYEGWMALANVKAGRFGAWLNTKSPVCVVEMEMRVNGVLIIKDEVEVTEPTFERVIAPLVSIRGIREYMAKRRRYLVPYEETKI